MHKQVIWTCAVLAAAAAALAPLDAQSASHTYAIEPAHTVVSFEVTNLGIAKRQGIFKDVTGTVLLDPQGGNGSIDIVVNARSIHTGDAATQAFVRGKSFLNVDEYSEIAYRAERVVFADGKPVRIEGKLTLLGVTRDVSLTVSGYECGDEGPAHTDVQASNGLCVLDAAAIFRRSEFGMDHYLGLVSDSVKLAIHGVATDAEAALESAPLKFASTR